MGRQFNNSDKEIYHELLKYHSPSDVKLDYDVIMEPCIFARKLSGWAPVYKLSLDGNYSRKRSDYVYDAAAAISKYFREQWIAFQLSKLKDSEESKFQEDFAKTQKLFAEQGFRDNLPQE